MDKKKDEMKNVTNIHFLEKDIDASSSKDEMKNS